MRSIAIGTAKRQSTTRAMTNGISATPLIAADSTFLIAFCALKLGKPGEGKHREHQDAHARAEISAVDRDEKLHGELPRRVARRRDRAARQQGTHGEDDRREEQQPRDQPHEDGLRRREQQTRTDQRSGYADAEHRQQQMRDAPLPLRDSRARCRACRPTSPRCSSRLPKWRARPRRAAPETRRSCRRRRRCSSRRRRTPRPPERRGGGSRDR